MVLLRSSLISCVFPLVLILPSFEAGPAAGTLRLVHKASSHEHLAPSLAIASPAFPVSLVDFGNRCKCTLNGVCDCQRALEFMRCIRDACHSGKCLCQDAHYDYACGNVSATCPKVPLSCDGEQASCPTGTGHDTVTRYAPAVVTGDTDQQPEKVYHTVTRHAPAGVTGDTDHEQVYRDLLSPRLADPDESSNPYVMKVPIQFSFPEPDMQGWDTWKVGVSKYLANSILGELGQLVLIVLCAVFYNKYRHSHDFTQKKPSTQGGKHFGYKLFGCFEDVQMSLLSCCCPALRWADTMDKARPTLLKYWIAIAVCLCLGFLGPLTLGLTSIALVGIMTYFRQRFRKQSNIQIGGLTILEDCCTYCLCSCCAIVQEARQVELWRQEHAQPLSSSGFPQSMA